MNNTNKILSDQEFSKVNRGIICAQAPQLLEKKIEIENRIKSESLADKDKEVAIFVVSMIDEELVNREKGVLRIIPFEEALMVSQLENKDELPPREDPSET